jgi:hypothetical protein
MEPVSTFAVGKEIVKVAVELARKYQEKATAEKASDIHKMCNYMAMAKVTVLGLFQERDAILSEANTLSAFNAAGEEQKRLAECRLRLERYMNESHLTPLLSIAIQGMEQYRDVLAKHLGGVVDWIFVRHVEKKTALDDVESVIQEVAQFREKLKYREKPSGIGLSHLKSLKSALEKGDNAEIVAVVAAARKADDDEFREVGLRLELISNNLDLAFR